MALDKLLLRESFASVAPHGERLMDVFYQELFDRYPGVKPLFTKTDMKAQKKKLLQALSFVIKNLDQPEEMGAVLRELGRKHAGFGAKIEHYPAVGEALIFALRKTSGGQWRKEMEPAWLDAYLAVASLMKEGGGSRIDELLKKTASKRSALTEHPVYGLVDSIERLRVFSEHHVYAVWDFMTLVKGLQQALTCTSIPWVPRADQLTRRLVNEIVLDEESDTDLDVGCASHYELYLRAMTKIGADTSAIEAFVADVERSGVPAALERSSAPLAVKEFVGTTWDIASSGNLHMIAAAFCIGREEIIPDMFAGIVAKLGRTAPERTALFEHYLRRHMDVDKNRHAPMARQMLENVCGDNAAKWTQAEEVVDRVLSARLALWDVAAQAARAA